MEQDRIHFVLFSLLLVSQFPLVKLDSLYKIGDRVIGRWTNNLYYPGKVEDVSLITYTILFDDGDKINHSICDNSAVIDDKCPQEVKAGQHVIGTWKGGHKYYIGYVKEVTSSGKFAVRFDDNGEDLYEKCDLRIFEEYLSPFKLGARVFARWTNGLYYRGFVTKTTDSKVFINYDDGDSIWLNKSNKTSVILDRLPKPNSVHPGQRVIGYWPNRVRYYPGTVISRSSTTYFVRYDDGDERHNKIYEIRIIPKFGIGDRVIGRWTNNLYYRGKVEDVSSITYTILFDDGDKIIHSIGDNSAVIDDKCPQEVKARQHVIGTWKGGHKYYIGYVKEVTSSGKFAVRFDDNDEDLYEKCDLRIFQEYLSPYKLGARVFARWTNGLYYRGFVTKTTDSKVFINYDDGDSIGLNKNDKSSVILDKLPKPNLVLTGQRVIGYWPNRVRYYPGTVVSRNSTTYFVRYDDGDERHNKIYEIRSIQGKLVLN